MPAAIPGAPELLSFRAACVAALCLIAAVFAVYSPTLRYEFVLDDHRFITDPRIQFSGHLWDYFANYVWAQFTGGPPSFYRPIFVLWLRINYIISESPWAWHLLSVTKHVTVAGLLALLAWRLLRDRMAALLAATLFALHPAQAESVAWVTVPDPLMSIAVIGALLFYLRSERTVSASDRASERRSSRTSRKQPQTSLRWLIASASAAACFAAMLAKETAILFPVVIFALAFFTPESDAARPPRSSDRGPSLADRFLAALRQTVPFLFAAALYLLLRLNALGGKLGAQTQHVAWQTVALSWPGILWFYIKVMLWPVRSYAFADPTLASMFSVYGVGLPVLGVISTLAALAAFLFWAWQNAARSASEPTARCIRQSLIIGTTLLVLPILLALNLNALNPGDFLHGRYTYLPLAGITLLFATGWHLAGSRLRIALLTAAALAGIVFAVLTLRQEPQWHDDLTLFSAAHQLAPHNAPVARNLANARVQAALQLNEVGRCTEALPVFQQVTQEYPDDWFAWAGLGDCFVQLNDLPRAEESLHRAADLSHNPRVVQQWQQLRASMGQAPVPSR